MANAPTYLYPYLHTLEHPFYMRKIARFSIHSAVQVDNMNDGCTLLVPRSRDGRNVLRIHCLRSHIALAKPDTTPVFEIDCRNDQHSPSLLPIRTETLP